MSKLRRHGSKRRRKSEGFHTPPCELPVSTTEEPGKRSLAWNARPSDHELQASSMSSPFLSPASPQSDNAAFSAIVPSYLYSPSESPAPQIELPISASSGAARRSSSHSSAHSAPATLPPWCSTLSATRTSKIGRYPKPRISATSLATLSDTPLSSEQRTLSASSCTLGRRLNRKPSFPVVVKQSVSLSEVVPSQSHPLKTLFGSWATKTRRMLSPLLGRLRPPSANCSPEEFQMSSQHKRANAAPEVAPPPCYVSGKQPRSASISRRQSQLRDSVQSMSRSQQSLSRTSLSFPRDASPGPPHAVNNGMASCLRREKASLLVGRNGRFQTTAFHFGLLIAFVVPFQTLPLQSVQQDIDHWCARPKNLRNMSTEEWKRQMVPRAEDGHYSRCRMYAEWNATSVATVPCTTWEYAPSVYHYSIVEEFGLVCERAWYLPLSCAAFAMGAICALLIMGPLADWLGRKPVMQFTVIVMQAAVMVILLFVRLNTFVVMRFLLGAATTTLFNTSFVLVVEVLAPERRTLYAMAVLLSKVIGAAIASTMMLAGFSWYTLHLASMLPCLMMLRSITCLVESPRWLLARGRLDEAETVIMHAATLNGENIFDVRHQWARQRRELERPEGTRQSTCCEAARLRCRLKNNAILYFCWCVTACTLQATWLKIYHLGFYPLSLMALFALLSIPGELGAMASAAHVGRKTSLAWALVIAAIALFATVAWGDANVVSSATLLTLASVVTDASQAVLTLYTAEVHPTVVRCSGLAMCTCFSTAATIATPLATYFGVLQMSWLPLVMVSLLGLSAAFLVVRLPDTKERTVLPDELSDIPFEQTSGIAQVVPDNTHIVSLEAQRSDKRRTLGER
ncbi:solute carrier family 22 member 13-like [Dermacentor andersoni]|uniref:solute carrier family 22 member 13-like n=1 Tax=Dermacentor andersoni TaxID=34620 RepID=UPI0021556E13